MQMENLQVPYGQIYRLTNKINGKMYHGQTIEKDINDRWKAYKGVYCKSQPKLYNALKSYRPENFLFEVIDTTPQNQSQLDELEIFYIAKFDSMNNGYNCDPGGKGGKKSEETKKKMCTSNKGKMGMLGKHHSEETKRKLSELRKGSKNGMFGKKIPDEIKEKVSQKLRGKLNPQYGKHLSVETKLKISQSLKLRKSTIHSAVH